jgi:Mannosyltransferase putative
LKQDQAKNHSLSPDMALAQLNIAISSLDAKRFINSTQDRGIVICGGGTKYFPGVWVCINMLRRLECQLPIELWHLGPGELNDTMRELVEPLGVSCVDGHHVQEKHPVRILNGWELKPFAIMHSRFREVLLLDADNVPIVDPTYLFDTPQYKDAGAIFWPDFGRLGADRNIWSLCGIPYRDEPEFESGQILLDKQRCWKELCLTMWFNEHSDFWYRHFHGDKESYHMAWRKLNRPYAMPSRRIHALPGTMCQHDFEGRRIFQHRNMAKWTILNNRRIPGFELEDLCLEILNQIAPHWQRISGISFYCEKNKTQAERDLAGVLTATRWIYERVGYDKRIMTFKPDGSVGEGAAGLEVTWDIRRQQEEFVLDIQSQDALTCRLTYGADGVWRGRWERHERMPIQLRAANASEHLETKCPPIEAEKITRNTANRCSD